MAFQERVLFRRQRKPVKEQGATSDSVADAMVRIEQAEAEDEADEAAEAAARAATHGGAERPPTHNKETP